MTSAMLLSVAAVEKFVSIFVYVSYILQFNTCYIITSRSVCHFSQYGIKQHV